MKQWLVCGAVFYCTALFSTQKPISLLIVDTQGKDPYYYRNLILLADSVGFKTDYKNLYDLLEDSDINQYQALFFMLSPRMLAMTSRQHFFNNLFCLLNAHHAHTIPEHCWNVLRSFAQQKNKSIAIILPGRINYSPKLQQDALQAMERLGIFQHNSQPTKQFIRSFITYITSPDSHKGSLFGTSLINTGNPTFPKITDSKGNNTTKVVDPKTKEINAILTPITPEQHTERIQQALPIGLLLKNKRNATYLISKSSEFDFADLAEHFFKNPISITDRNGLLKAAQESLLALRMACTQKIPEQIKAPRLPKQFTPSYLKREKQRCDKIYKEKLNKNMYGWVLKDGISCAWLDPYDFYAHEDAQQKLKHTVIEQNKKLDETATKQKIDELALKRGIQLIYNARFNLLWFEFIPEWYMSPHGIRKEQKMQYIQRISRLAKELRTFFATHNTPLPKIFVGMNLTSNFTTYPVRNPVQDVFGFTYTKIPCPFDLAHFWKPEVLDIFDVFIATFKKHLPIDGLFFDFEMYHAPHQAGMYTDHMDFSDMAWRTYCSYTNNKDAQHITSVKKRVAYLQKEKKFTQYFTTLKQASRKLGMMIKRYMRKQKPNLMFGAYAPTLPYSWFYCGIMAGLSSESEPLLLATFNTDHASHSRWLTNHNIHILHGSAIMLSKLQKEEDFNLIPSLLTHHNFVWYNRPSRMIYECNQKELDKVWWGIEATPLSVAKTMKNIRTHHHILQPNKS